MLLTTVSKALLAFSALTKPAYTANQYVQSNSVIWDDDNWSLTNTKLEQGAYQSRVTLANGYLGINVAATGPFFEFDTPVGNDSIIGWPLFSRRQAFATIAGFYNSQDRTNGTNFPWLYQYGWDSVISGVPHWSGLVVEVNGAWLNASTDPEHISRFSSRLDVGVGILNWWYTWKPNGDGPAIDVEYRMFVHKLHVNQAAVQLKLTSSRDVNATVYDVLDGDCAVRTDFVEKQFVEDQMSIWTAVNPSNLANITAYIYSTLQVDNSTDAESRKEVTEGPFGANVSSIAQAVDVQLQAEKTVVVAKFIGGASSDAFEDAQNVAKEASINGASIGFSELLKSHIEEWETILTPDSVDNYHLPDGSLPDDPNIQDLEILAHTNPFFLLQNTVGPNAIATAGNNTRLNINSIPVCGLGSDCYAGMIFWDSDVWMAPGLQVSHPQHVENFVKYRVEKSDQARENVKTAFSSSKNQTGRFSEGGAAYPWTSGRYGNCTGTGPCFDYQYHLNGDISIMFNNYLAVTGDSNYFKEELLPISNAIAWMFSEALDFNETSGFWELWNATDPDEYANMVNNIGFTTAVFQRQFNETNEFNSWFGLERNESWIDKSVKMRLPINEEADIIVEYDGMNGSVTLKQADIVLIDDFLHYPNEYSLSNLDYYAAKQSADGPAMTYSSYAIVANEISPSGCSSYTYDLYSSEPYMRAPWYQFSEQLNDDVSLNGGTHPAFPFLTGMGGANRVAIFGYLGLRLFHDRLDVDPSLPPQIQHLNYRTFYWQGYGINATSNSTHTTLSRLPKELYTLPNANTTFADSPIPVTLGTRPGTFSLNHDTPLILENRLVGQKQTVQGNILQCASIVVPTDSDSAYVPGQFPLAAIDGAASTKWQPLHSNTTSYLTVNLSSSSSPTYHPIKSLLFDWGAQPPAYYEVLFSNTSLPPFNPESLPDDVVNVTAGRPEVSSPYDSQTAFVVKAYKGNQTNITLERITWSGEFVHLGIRGNLAGDDVEVGATVAEWSVVREGA